MKISASALAFTLFVSRNSPSRAFSSAATILSSTRYSSSSSHSIYLARSTVTAASTTTTSTCSSSSTTARNMSAETLATTDAAVTAANPFLDRTDLPKFSLIEPSQLTPAMASILEKLEADFAAMESKLSEEEKQAMDYDDVLPVVEKIQHPLGQ
jgi:hypothetical protein